MSRPSAPTRSRRLCRTLTFSLLLAPALLSAQQAVLTGRVSGTGSEGLADSRVMLVNTSTVTQTNSEGRYTIRNVPTGTIEVRVIRVGYAEQKKSVVVAPGASITLDFALTALVVQLQEVVTTATGEQRKVEIGNALSTISAPQAVEQTAVSNIADLLVAKAPGVIMSPPNMSGSAPVIRIRGLNSLSLGNAPIMIVDGVRFFSSSISPGVGGTNESFMNSLSPEEIEDIEIVKGPSAATLYGTDAANGVIVVTTKKGRAGAARWNWFASTQQVEDRNKYPATYALWGHNPATGKITRCELATMSATTCVVDSTTSFDLSTTPGITPIANGLNTNFGGQVSGGNDAVRYFASGDLFNEVGPYKMPGFAQEWLQDSAQSSVRDEWVHPEAFQRQNIRANVSANVSPKFDLNVTTGFSKSDQRLPQVDNNVNGIGGMMYLTYGTDHGGLDYNPVGSLGEGLHGYARWTPASAFQFVNETGIQRLSGSADAEWRPFNWLQNQAVVGMDLADQIYFDICRFTECPAFGSNRLGFVDDEHDNNRAFTVKLVSNASWTAKPWINLKTTGGADYLNNEGDFSRADGSTLPPGAQTTGAGAVKNASDGQQSVTKTLGVYVQEQASLRDRMYITAAVRSDQNSAFGTNFQRVFYPKVSLSWIMSDEAFFPKWSFINQFRLRSAYGQSGVQPGATDGLRRFSTTTVAVANIDTPGLIESSLGNPNLKPETSGEFEGGFETRVWGNRANIDFTYYNKKTKDALISLPIAPSASPSRDERAHEPRRCPELGPRSADQRDVHRLAPVRLGRDGVRVAQQQQGALAWRRSRRQSQQDDRHREYARLGGLSGERRLPASVSLHRFERRRHHPDVGAHGRHGRRLSRLLVPARPPFGAERIRSVLAQAARARHAGLQGRLQPLQSDVGVLLPTGAAIVPGERAGEHAAVAAGARRREPLWHDGERHQVHLSRRLLGERPVLAAPRGLGDADVAERAGESAARARREPRRGRAQSPRLDQVHGHRSRSELLHGRRPDRLHHHWTGVVLRVPAQSPLLTDEDEFTC